MNNQGPYPHDPYGFIDEHCLPILDEYSSKFMLETDLNGPYTFANDTEEFMYHFSVYHLVKQYIHLREKVEEQKVEIKNLKDGDLDIGI